MTIPEDMFKSLAETETELYIMFPDRASSQYLNLSIQSVMADDFTGGSKEIQGANPLNTVAPPPTAYF